MLIVTGSVQVRPSEIAEAIAASLDHVRRSRLEPGCQLHSVHQDVEDPNRLVFLEHWADADALKTHFKVPESNAFVTQLQTLVTSPEYAIYTAERAAL